MLTVRQAGILLHPTSLPGPEGIGTLGEEAYTFVNDLAAAGQSVWQILPLGPTGYGDCPYSSFSAFAGNPDLISLGQLAKVGDLSKADLPAPQAADDRVNFAQSRKIRMPLLSRAANNFFARRGCRWQKFETFCRQQASWLNDYTFYHVMRRIQNNRSWNKWPTALRDRQESTLRHWGTKLAGEIAQQKYIQFVFFDQWFALKNYANQKKIQIFGDLPIFVAYDSADVWGNRSQFQLNEQGASRVIAGVPPDFFSATGQLWGNPLYDWQRMKQDGYYWWKTRLRWNLQLYDLIRIDHFRGFEACWAVPATETTAVNGAWQPGPGADFFNSVMQKLGELPLIAEDLGIITPQVELLRDRFKLPGMKILQFAFDSGPHNPYLPHQHPRNAVVYTGTHDNNTSLAWWQALDASAKKTVRNYLASPCYEMPWPLIRCALASTARLAIIPMQDLLNLGAKARMNQPGTATGNWNWRMEPEQFAPPIAERLFKFCRLFDRLPGINKSC